MTTLRVLHVDGADPGGGASRAAWRIHAALGDQGVESWFLSVRAAAPASPQHCRLQPLGPAAQLARRAKLALSARAARLQHAPTNPALRSINRFGNGLGRWINRAGFDVVHLHWVGDETLTVEEIGQLQPRICWTLHDMWAFCGAEHYDDLAHPGRYRTAYDADTRPPGYRGPDLDAWVWRRKQRAWANQRLHLVGPSRWITECAGASRLLGHQPRNVIPNCLDTDCFAPRPRAQARAAWGLTALRKYILFGAQAGTADPRKGFDLLLAALRSFAATGGAENTDLVVFGAGGASLPDLGMHVHHVGPVDEPARLALLYAAADVFAAPSIQDNLPNTVVESLACGTPVVAFRTGGLPELVDHETTGWLAESFDPADFAAGLSYVLSRHLRVNCRAAALARFTTSTVASRYAALYRTMLEERR
jgi:glycosyltransferase involved in cell wall biosynthesis